MKGYAERIGAISLMVSAALLVILTATAPIEIARDHLASHGLLLAALAFLYTGARILVWRHDRKVRRDLEAMGIRIYPGESFDNVIRRVRAEDENDRQAIVQMDIALAREDRGQPRGQA
jgi:hypothetical protein